MLHLQEKKKKNETQTRRPVHSVRIFMEGIEIPQGMEEEGLSKKRRVPQQKEIKKERRVCDIIGKQKKKGGT